MAEITGNFSFFIKKPNGEYIPFKSYTVQDKNGAGHNASLEWDFIQKKFKSRKAIFETLGAKFIANKYTPLETEATPNDIYVVATSINWKNATILTLSCTLVCFAVPLFSHEPFLSALKAAGITAGIFASMILCFWLRTLEYKAQAKKWNKDFIKLKTLKEMQEEEIHDALSEMPLMNEEELNEFHKEMATKGLEHMVDNIDNFKMSTMLGRLKKETDLKDEPEIEMPD